MNLNKLSVEQPFSRPSFVHAPTGLVERGSREAVVQARDSLSSLEKEATQLHFVQGRWTYTGRKSLYGSSEIHDHIMLIPKEESGRKAHLPSSRFNGNGAFRKGMEYVIAWRRKASLKDHTKCLPGNLKLLYFITIFNLT